jgi:hypothetical protein
MNWIMQLFLRRRRFGDLSARDSGTPGLEDRRTDYERRAEGRSKTRRATSRSYSLLFPLCPRIWCHDRVGWIPGPNAVRQRWRRDRSRWVRIVHRLSTIASRFASAGPTSREGTSPQRGRGLRTGRSNASSSDGHLDSWHSSVRASEEHTRDVCWLGGSIS